ncbi:MAG: hypothetical protein DWQ31_16705 [Planctomycetota bacterium]|nr:MAG: hypothetical protein DWQ31_16705 [Planctomycetota bacterium]REJ91994.1 MAG: hypothetical protein DWQ35_12655 [Planctomycetota bacterium]REK28530.1 MAG: hypothetical protein DWQ42_04245 [Planctomycetota bacterium]REK39145.1 MAG: hypothetical protein DWQ46_17830 [Planctomycetota bacterium]
MCVCRIFVFQFATTVPQVRPVALMTRRFTPSIALGVVVSSTTPKTIRGDSLVQAKPPAAPAIEKK